MKNIKLLDANYHLGALLLLTLLVFVSHGLLLINDGVYWDGWILYGTYLNHDVDSMLNMFREAGAPLSGYFHLGFRTASNFIFAYKLAAFFSIWLSTLIVFEIAKRFRFLSLRECLFIAAIFCCYTGYQTHVQFITLPYTFFFMVFWVGVYFAFRMLESKGGVSIFFRLLALITFSISFLVNSLLVFFFPLLIALIIYQWREHKGWRNIARIGFLLDFFLLPFIYWKIKNTLWIPYGLYAGYNSLRIPDEWSRVFNCWSCTGLYHDALFAPIPDFWKRCFVDFKSNSIEKQFGDAFNMLWVHPLLSVGLTIGCFVAVRIFSAWRLNEGATPENSGAIANLKRDYIVTGVIALYASWLLMSAMLPYAIVGAQPDAFGVGTRHALLIALPIAVWLVVLGRIISWAIRPEQVARAMLLCASLLVALFLVNTGRIYVEWEARWIKDSSVIANLKNLPMKTIDSVRVIMVEDQFVVGPEFYDFYEYAGMFKLAWQQENRVGFHYEPKLEPSELIELLETLPLPRYMLKDFRFCGCGASALLHIRAGNPLTSHGALVASYYWYRWFDPSGLQSFLQGVTKLEMTAFPVHCDGLDKILRDVVHGSGKAASEQSVVKKKACENASHSN